MLIKYDAKSGVWIASGLVDGHPCVVMSRDMKRAMQLMGRLLTAPPMDIDTSGLPYETLAELVTAHRTNKPVIIN